MGEAKPKLLSLDEFEKYVEPDEKRPHYNEAAGVVVGKFASILNLDDDAEWLARQMDRQTGAVFVASSFFFDHLDECAIVARGVE